MMVLRRSDSSITHALISDLPDYFAAGDLLVANNSRVFPARLYGLRRDTGGKVEVLFVEERAGGAWEVMTRARGRLRPGVELEFAGGAFSLKVLELLPRARALVEPASADGMHALLEKHGMPPLPPYIRRGRKAGAPGDDAGALRSSDLERYQTVYAEQRGSIAAPTAGLHFTRNLLSRLAARGVRAAYLTLHVGPGTFIPIKSESLSGHRMESERYFLPRATAEAISSAIAGGRRVIGVGTTVVRALETAASGGGLREVSGRSSLFIYPPYEFRVVNAMLTNFHLPRSTPLAMVSALAGADFIKRAYAEAIREQYRFYSYGDCMLIL